MTSISRRPGKTSLLSLLFIVTFAIAGGIVDVPAASARAVSSTSAHASQANVTPASPVDGTPYILVNYNSFKCLDATGNGTTDGVLLQQWSCRSPSTQNQKWVFFYHGAYHGDGVYYIVEDGTNECLDAQDRGVSNGTRIQLWTCKYTANQFWILQDGTPGDWGHLWNYGATVSRNVGIALDVACTASTGDGQTDRAPVQLWQETTSNGCNGSNQLWTFTSPL